jgi:hypothetical protein
VEQTAPAIQQTAAQAPTSWSAEALEDLLAPIALYPDPVLSQVLMASANPQEVLDAGNWILENQSLKGKALDDAAAAIGFTPPVRALLQFPDTLDMMCRELGWTTELGEAFIADQAGVLDAVQRLRRQAKDVGNLQSSPQMTVDTQTQAGKEVIVLEPPASTNTVYVPQYDPVAVYAPAPATTELAPAAATTTTTTETKSGYSTGAMVTTGLLSFGAGMLVNELFDDDDNNKYKYPNYGYGGMPYYPPYPYRPSYGNGYYPSNGYRPPPGYGGGFHNSGNIVVTNPGGGRGDNGYWDRYDNNRAGAVNRNDRYKSPISSAKPNRPELNDLNKRQPRAMPANVQRPNKDAAPKQYKGNQTYAGAKDGGYKGAAKGAAGTAAAKRPDARPTPKVQGSYKGGTAGGSKVASNGGYKGASKDMAKPASRPAQAPSAKRPNAGNVRPPSSGGGDRGYAKPTSKPVSRPAQMPNKPASMPKPQSSAKPANRSPQHAGGGAKQHKPSAMSGSGGGGKANKAASQRGKQSMPQGARSKGGGGGGKKGKR